MRKLKTLSRTVLVTAALLRRQPNLTWPGLPTKRQQRSPKTLNSRSSQKRPKPRQHHAVIQDHLLPSASATTSHEPTS
jgi:hypothetical protein